MLSEGSDVCAPAAIWCATQHMDAKAASSQLLYTMSHQARNCLAPTHVHQAMQINLVTSRLHARPRVASSRVNSSTPTQRPCLHQFTHGRAVAHLLCELPRRQQHDHVRPARDALHGLADQLGHDRQHKRERLAAARARAADHILARQSRRDARGLDVKERCDALGAQEPHDAGVEVKVVYGGGVGGGRGRARGRDARAAGAAAAVCVLIRAGLGARHGGLGLHAGADPSERLRGCGAGQVVAWGLQGGK